MGTGLKIMRRETGVLLLVESACGRAAAKARARLARGQRGLAWIVGVAPLLGAWTYPVGIINSFKGGGGEKSQMMAAIADGLSEAGLPFAFTLALAIFALIQYQTWQAHLERLDAEMRAATLALINDLARSGPPVC